MALPSDIPPEAIPFLQEMGYLESDQLHVGDSSPQITLSDLAMTNTTVIGATDSPQPTVLIFGSYT